MVFGFVVNSRVETERWKLPVEPAEGEEITTPRALSPEMVVVPAVCME